MVQPKPACGDLVLEDVKLHRGACVFPGRLHQEDVTVLCLLFLRGRRGESQSRLICLFRCGDIKDQLDASVNP